MDWLQEAQWYSPTNLDNGVFENVQNIRPIINFIASAMENLRVKLKVWDQCLEEVETQRVIF